MDFRRPLKDVLKKQFPTVNIEDTLKAAIKTMARDNTSALLVKQDGNLVGVITLSDILYSLAREEDPETIKVATFMTSCELLTTKGAKTPCAQLDEDENLLSAIKVMNEAGVSHILVSGSSGEPAGMVSSLEIIKMLPA